MARSLDRELLATKGRRRVRAISAAVAVAQLERNSRPPAPQSPPFFPMKGTITPRLFANVWKFAIRTIRTSCVVLSNLFSRVWAPPQPLRTTILASTIFLAVIITTTVVAGDIDLSKFMPGTEMNGRPHIIVIDGRLVNQGDGPAINLEVTRPAYRLVGMLAVGDGFANPANDFAVQYEWREGDKVHRETRAFKTGQERVAGNRTSADHTALHAVSIMAPHDSGTLPQGLAASYDPVTHLLTVSADRPIEVRVDGFLLRPVSRTDKEGAEYRYAQANVLILGQDLKRGETTVFEVVFIKPQDFYSIPIYVREPGKPAVYLTVSTSLRAAP